MTTRDVVWGRAIVFEAADGTREAGLQCRRSMSDAKPVSHAQPHHENKIA
jgi:hypothetical protein